MISRVMAQLIDWMHLFILHKKHQDLDIFKPCLFYSYLFCLALVGLHCFFMILMHLGGLLSLPPLLLLSSALGQQLFLFNGTLNGALALS